MNIIALDIGNTNITVAFFLDDAEQFVVSVPGDDVDKLTETVVEAWQQIPFVSGANVQKRDGFIAASSVKPVWTEFVRAMCKEELDEKLKVVGEDIRLPIEMGVDDYRQVGTDRVVCAAAAFAVVQDAVVVADVGTAITVDLVDEQGVFLGGVIAPGFRIASKALSEATAMLPEVEVHKPKDAIGANTPDAVNCGLYYSAVGLLRVVCEEFAAEIGRWPQVIVTGGGGAILKDGCDFVDTWVNDLAVRGVVLAFKKHLDDTAQQDQWEEEEKKK